ncbi:FtsX-like permease family protein [Piscinibacter sakaiensis]|uniref:ABC transporter permease n=1 Tax=Piscinibacter sakaiensis TaxID=1547922 RepID=UPI003AAFB781
MTDVTASRAVAPLIELRWQLAQLSWPELRHQPWRHLTALLAVVLGVALAFSVHLINDSALGEFSAAVRSVNGQPDFELRAQRAGFDESVYARVASDPRVAAASPVIELETQAWDSRGERFSLRVIGIDPLAAARLSPDLLPQRSRTDRGNGSGNGAAELLDPDVVYLNGAARQRLASAGSDLPQQIGMQSGIAVLTLPIVGRVAAGGPPLAVLDIAGAQAHFGWLGRLSRIDVRLVPGADRETLLRDLALPSGVRAALPDESAQRVSNVSRAYRVNLTVLALVALFTGAFLVFSILSLSVARRLPQLALLGVLGLGANERLRLIVAESVLLGLLGSLLGLALGTALATLALRLLAGDLGGGYFPGVTPTLHFSAIAAAMYGLLGIAAAVVGGLLPARIAQSIAPAQVLKGLGAADQTAGRPWLGLLLLGIGGALAFAPPIAGLSLAAYLAVALLLLGGIVAVPSGVGLLLRAVAPPRRPLALLAVQRARHQRHSATIAVAGVVASLALAVALTVMVASFRDSVTQWLDTVLPADLYARTSGSGGADNSFLPPELVTAIGQLPGIERLEAQRVTQIQIDPQQPAVALLARPVPEPARRLPLVGGLQPVPAGAIAAYVSEPMVSLHGARAGHPFSLPLPDGRRVDVHIAGVWRDYARQSGAVLLDAADYQRLTGDRRINDLAIWLQPGAAMAELQQAIHRLAATAAGQTGDGAAAELIDFASAGELRATSLRIFDRSFAVTYWLQAVAIGIGLFGIAASFSAQVLARRKEFGLLAHLGLTRRQVLALVAAEAAVWTAAGAVLGLLLGIAVSVILVKVVNPQSFHWTMELVLPAGRLAILCLAVMVAGTLTAWLSARAAGGRDMVLAVKEDW